MRGRPGCHVIQTAPCMAELWREPAGSLKARPCLLAVHPPMATVSNPSEPLHAGSRHLGSAHLQRPRSAAGFAGDSDSYGDALHLALFFSRRSVCKRPTVASLVPCGFQSFYDPYRLG